MSYPYETPPAGPVPCVICYRPTRNHRAIWNYEWSGAWHSACRDWRACARRAGC